MSKMLISKNLYAWNKNASTLSCIGGKLLKKGVFGLSQVEEFFFVWKYLTNF